MADVTVVIRTATESRGDLTATGVVQSRTVPQTACGVRSNRHTISHLRLETPPVQIIRRVNRTQTSAKKQATIVGVFRQ